MQKSPEYADTDGIQEEGTRPDASPAQNELYADFIVKYMDELPCKIFMGVGGSFDVIAEKVNRAPRWMINIGMEWAYRVSKEPWRIKRLGSIPKFIGIVIKNRGKKYER